MVVRAAFLGARRFEQFQESLGIPRNVLTERLRTLVDEGILEKRAYHDRPVRYEYRLTEKGVALYPVIIAMMRWGDEWLDWPDGPPLELSRPRDGRAGRTRARRPSHRRPARSSEGQGPPAPRGRPRMAESSCQRLVGILDLDRRHPHRPRRLQVDAEVVEEHDLARPARRGARAPARRRRDQACARRPSTTPRRRRTARRATEDRASRRRVHRAQDVVRQQRRPQPGAPAGPHSVDHRRTEVAGEQRRAPPGRRRRGRARSDSARKAAANPSRSSSLRSKRAHAFVSGSVALTRRRKPAGKPCSSSYRANASNGDDDSTPPKSHSTAR